MAADAAIAAVTHGTTSYAMPAAFSASAFSAPSAQTPGSPHFKRTTRFPCLAAATITPEILSCGQ